MAAQSYKNALIAVVGPTASGKTSVAIRLAHTFSGEVISADSRQIYRGLDIGTDKVSPEDTAGIPHYCIDVAEPGETFTAADFRTCATTAIQTITNNSHLPIVAGGTGFYIDALTGRLTLPDVPPDPAVRTQLSEKSAAELYEALKAAAPERAKTIEPDNKRRLVRAHEILRARGHIPPPPTSEGAPYAVCWVGLDRPDAELASRITARAREQIDGGLLAEIADLETRNFAEDTWREFGFEYTIGRQLYHGEIDADTAVDELQRANMQYAKRQRKYFKRNSDIVWFHPEESDAITEHVRAFLASV